jgi:hypothetical protein
LSKSLRKHDSIVDLGSALRLRRVRVSANSSSATTWLGSRRSDWSSGWHTYAFRPLPRGAAARGEGARAQLQEATRRRGHSLVRSSSRTLRDGLGRNGIKCWCQTPAGARQSKMARDERFRHHSTRWWHRVQQGCNHATVHAWADVCAFSQLLMLTLSAMLNNNETSGQTVARRSSADHTFEHARSATQHHHSHHAPDRPWHRPSPPRS